MTIIPKSNEESNALQKRFSGFVERFGVNRILRSVRATKEKGVAVYDIFVALLGLVFTHKNLYTLLATDGGALSFAKDTVYRFLGNARINWEQFVFRLSAAVIPEINALTSESRRTVLILDDTPYYRNRSKKVELLSRCYDNNVVSALKSAASPADFSERHPSNGITRASKCSTSVGLTGRRSYR